MGSYHVLILLLLVVATVYGASYSEVASHLPSDSQYSTIGPKMTIDTSSSGSGYSSDGRYFMWGGKIPRKSYQVSQQVRALEKTYDSYGNVTAIYLADFTVMISEYSDTSYMDNLINKQISDAENKGCARITDGYACSDPSGTGIKERYTLLRNKGYVVVKISVRSRPGPKMGYSVAGYIAKHKSIAYAISNIIFNNYGLTEKVIVDPTKSSNGNNSKTKPDSILQKMQEINRIIQDSINKLKLQHKGTNQPVTVESDKITLKNGQEITGTKLQKAQQTKAKIQAAATSDKEIIHVNSPDGGKVKIVKRTVTADKNKEPGKFYKVKKFFSNQADNIYDQIANNDPTSIMKAFKNYFSSAKDNVVYTNKEKIQNEADRLGVDKIDAKYYSQFSSIPDTEKKFSTIKNTLPSSTISKPFEYVIDQMGVSVEKEIAHSYRKEYELTKAHAKKYAKLGMSWSQIIANTKRDIQEMTLGQKTITDMGGTIPTDYLNTMSKDSGGAYNAKTQEGRILIYINEMKGAGLLTRPQDEVSK